VFPPTKIFTTPIYPPSQNLAKTSWTLPLDFQTLCIYDRGRRGRKWYVLKNIEIEI
jgi:hypothetical protein